MTEQEALKRLKDILDEATTDENAVCYVTDYDEIPLRLAIKALEKQIPKKPIIKTNLMTKHVSAHCSICDTDITYYSSGENYCHNCGQALRWE